MEGESHLPSLIRTARELAREVEDIRFGPPVAHVYNPLRYAWNAHEEYLRRYGRGPKEVVLVGMNPGPWGMAQTGVPFGEVELVRSWLGIEVPVGRPPDEHPKRPVEGFACHRREVSGQRLWGWASRRFGTPKSFFERFFVANYCPLLFLELGGRNRTPDRLAAGERSQLAAVCDRALLRSVEALAPRFVVGVGKFAEDRCRRALVGMELTIGRILHPSPASPAANRDWEGQAVRELEELGIDV
ncbi:MAG: single-strand selective monofunctional uracil-DNA glycosylase [Acidobacteria bacterium]|nr:MAG: single-strand selective monofunctional uracil-DNA glycosylase [Acidobacteriota bacterium]